MLSTIKDDVALAPSQPTALLAVAIIGFSAETLVEIGTEGTSPNTVVAELEIVTAVVAGAGEKCGRLQVLSLFGGPNSAVALKQADEKVVFVLTVFVVENVEIGTKFSEKLLELFEQYEPVSVVLVDPFEVLDKDALQRSGNSHGPSLQRINM